MTSSRRSKESALDPRANAPVVFVVDDDISVRESLELLIRYDGLRVVTFASAHEFLAYPRLREPSCLVLDVHLPDLSGLDLQNQVTTDQTTMPIIFITGSGDVPMTVRAMKEGAVEFLVKPCSEDVLRAAIRNAIGQSEAAMGGEAAVKALLDDYAKLSRREREVMALVVAGRPNKQIAAEIGISQITVKAHRGRAMRKMRAASLADLVTKAARIHAVGR